MVFLMLTALDVKANNFRDSIVFEGHNYIIGEIKSLEKGVLTLKTPYSKENFKIKWLEVAEVFSDKKFLLINKSGLRGYGSLLSPERGKITVHGEELDDLTFPITEVVSIQPLEKGILSGFNAEIDMGFTLTRVRSQRQFSLRSRFGYITKTWSFDGSYNKLYTSQDGTNTIRRGDGQLTSIYAVSENWLVLGRIDYLYNTAQLIDLRLNNKLGVGRYLFNSNRMMWTALGGLSYNVENFDSEVSQKRSVESWIGSEINIFDIKKISLLSNVYLYPSLTEKDRIRVDFRLDLKYDLPLDFYLKTGTTLNYDRQPVGGSTRLDYIVQTTFGWSFSK